MPVFRWIGFRELYDFTRMTILLRFPLRFDFSTNTDDRSTIAGYWHTYAGRILLLFMITFGIRGWPHRALFHHVMLTKHTETPLAAAFHNAPSTVGQPASQQKLASRLVIERSNGRYKFHPWSAQYWYFKVRLFKMISQFEGFISNTRLPRLH